MMIHVSHTLMKIDMTYLVERLMFSEHFLCCAVDTVIIYGVKCTDNYELSILSSVLISCPPLAANSISLIWRRGSLLCIIFAKNLKNGRQYRWR